LVERQRQADEEKAAQEAKKTADEHAKVEAALTAARTKTFRACAEEYERAHRLEWTNPAFRDSWLRSLEIHAYPILGDLPVAVVDRQLIKQVLSPIWDTKTKTAKDLRGRNAKVLGWAMKEGYRSDGPNPAAWADNLDVSLAKPSAIAKTKRCKPLPYTDIATFMTNLRAVDTTTARMLEFAILNASRSGEVRHARWSEIDLAKRTWTILKGRMKTRIMSGPRTTSSRSQTPLCRFCSRSRLTKTLIPATMCLPVPPVDRLRRLGCATRSGK
jgi:integrase